MCLLSAGPQVGSVSPGVSLNPSNSHGGGSYHWPPSPSPKMKVTFRKVPGWLSQGLLQAGNEPGFFDSRAHAGNRTRWGQWRLHVGGTSQQGRSSLHRAGRHGPGCPHEAQGTSRGKTLVGDSQRSQTGGAGARAAAADGSVPRAAAPAWTGEDPTLPLERVLMQVSRDGWRFAPEGVASSARDTGVG